MLSTLVQSQPPSSAQKRPRSRSPSRQSSPAGPLLITSVGNSRDRDTTPPIAPASSLPGSSPPGFFSDIDDDGIEDEGVETEGDGEEEGEGEDLFDENMGE